MKKENIKLPYREPVTQVAAVEAEGFICVSIQCIQLHTEVDEYVNEGFENLDFDSDY